MITFIIVLLIGIGIFFFQRGIRNRNNVSPQDTRLANIIRLVSFGVMFIAFIPLAFSMAITVPAGHIGVKTFFGDVDDESLNSGFHFINPLSKVTNMDIRTQTFTTGEDGITVLAKDGLSVEVEFSVNYRLNKTSAPTVYEKIGETYADKVIIPEIRSSVRDNAVSYTSTDLYSSKREEFVSNIQKELEPIFLKRGIVLENVLLRDVELPKEVQNSINQKIASQQEAQRMEFVLLKEKQEADRKRIEAQGIQDFQKIVQQGISPQLLEWKGIEATIKLAESNNAKVVVIGNSKGLPLILGN